MSGKNESTGQRIQFFKKNSPYFGDLIKIAEDYSVQNMPVQVCSSDTLMRKWFSETICYCKYQTTAPFTYIPCSVVSSDSILKFLETCSGNSVVFLDQIEAKDLSFQADFFDIIQSESFVSRNILIVAGTSCNLDEKTEQNQFLKSLCFRLNLLKVAIPSINEIKSEIITFAEYFLALERFYSGKDFKGFSDSAKQALSEHYWNGGITELRNTVSNAVLKGEPPVISGKDLGFSSSIVNDIASDVSDNLSEDKSMKNALDSFKRVYVKKILEENGNNQTKAAKVLGLQRTYVSRLMSELDIR